MKYKWRICPFCHTGMLLNDFYTLAMRIGSRTCEIQACYVCWFGSDLQANSIKIYEGSNVDIGSSTPCSRCRLHYISLNAENASTQCDQCFEAYGERTILDYSTNVLHVIKTPNIRNNMLYLGLELELETPNSDLSTGRNSLAKKTLEWIGKDFAITKRDGSVPGFELVTIPATLVSHREKWEDAIVKRADQMPKGIVAWEGGNNGLHIHVSRKPLPATIVPKLRSFMYSKDNFNFMTNVAGRTSDRFANLKNLAYRNNKTGAAAYIGPKQTTKFNYKSQVDLGNKYQGLYVHHLGATLEFRLFKPTLEYDRLMVDLEFAQSLIEFLSNSPLGDLKTYEYKTYLQWIEKNKSFEYSHVRKFFRDGRHEMLYGMLPKEPKKPKVAAVSPNPTLSTDGIPIPPGIPGQPPTHITPQQHGPNEADIYWAAPSPIDSSWVISREDPTFLDTDEDPYENMDVSVEDSWEEDYEEDYEEEESDSY